MNPQGGLGNTDAEGMAALREALQRRQQGGQMPAMDTQSSSSPTASPLPADPMGSPAPMGGGLMGAGAESGGSMPSVENQEARLIVGALKERLKAISTIEGGVPPKGMA